ncbi:hypothetical protein PIB30_039285 [Stylosanthes scabra]|uniref:Uncharacterized protein n=1 Tax=Stylosanthes scabra TaxID=79078 RepID=A0ABU6XFJ6_9FABA|nr:hypothetical protein [Stylosanthes scabra]
MREAQKGIESQLSHLTELLHKFTNQTTIGQQVQPQPSIPNPLSSQPLPNPKGGINVVHNEGTNGEGEGEEEEEEEEGVDEWLYELLVELADSDESDDEEEVESNTEEEVEEEVAEDRDEGKTFFIATIFNEERKTEEEIPIKCNDPGPCLFTCKIR